MPWSVLAQLVNFKAFVLGLMEMVVHSVSTRKVARITEALCGATFSKSTVSRLTKALDVPVSRSSDVDLMRRTRS